MSLLEHKIKGFFVYKNGLGHLHHYLQELIVTSHVFANEAMSYNKKTETFFKIKST